MYTSLSSLNNNGIHHIHSDQAGFTDVTASPLHAKGPSTQILSFYPENRTQDSNNNININSQTTNMNPYNSYTYNISPRRPASAARVKITDISQWDQTIPEAALAGIVKNSSFICCF